MPVNVDPASIAVGRDHERSLGSVDMTALPPWSTATHSDADGQEIALSVFDPSMGCSIQFGLFAVGFLDVSIRPSPSTATQSDAEAHEMPANRAVGPTRVSA